MAKADGAHGVEQRANKQSVPGVDEQRMPSQRKDATDRPHGSTENEDSLCSLWLRVQSKAGWVQSVVSVSILCYSATLAATSSLPDPASAGFHALRIVSALTIAVWTVEVGIKIAGFGARRLLRNSWNLLDCACLASLAVDAIAVPGVSFAYLRLLKVCRPLVPCTGCAKFQKMIDGMCHAFRLLPPILSLFGIFAFLSAVLGSQLFGSDGHLYNRCVKPISRLNGQGVWAPVLVTGYHALPSQIAETAEDGEHANIGSGAIHLFRNETEYVLVLPESHCVNASQALLWGSYQCDPSDGQECQRVADVKPFDGVESFDNTLKALIVICFAILQQKYDHVFTGTMDISGDLSNLYFLVVTMLGVFFMLNYTTAILSFAYSQACGRTPSEHLAIGSVASGSLTACSTSENLDRSQTSDKMMGGRRDAPGDEHNENEHSKPGNDGLQEKAGLRHNEHVLRGVVSAQQFLDRSLRKLSSARARTRRSFGACTNALVLPFAVVAAYPNPVRPEVGLCAMDFRATPYVEVLLRLAIVTHVSLLASLSYHSSEEYEATLRTADEMFLVFFVCIELLRVLAYCGLSGYLIRSNNRLAHLCDILTTAASCIIWISGSSQRLQVGSFRIVRLLTLMFQMNTFRRARHVLWVCAGRNSDLLIASGVVIFGDVICALILRQVYHRVKVDRQLFSSFPSSFITLLEISAGDSLQRLVQDGHNDLGSHAVIIAICMCFIVKHVINKIPTAVVLQNLHSDERDKITYQLQFERMSWLYGWDDEERSHHWLNTRDHTELLQHGETQVLIPDTGGVFERVHNSRDSYIVQNENSLQAKLGFHCNNLWRAASCLTIPCQWLIGKTSRRLPSDGYFNLKIRVARCSVAFCADPSSLRIIAESCLRNDSKDELGVVKSVVSGPPARGAIRWDDIFAFDCLDLSDPATKLRITVVNDAKVPVCLGRVVVDLCDFIVKEEDIRTYHLTHLDALSPTEREQDRLITLHVKRTRHISSMSIFRRARLKLKSMLQHDLAECVVLIMVMVCICFTVFKYEVRGTGVFFHSVDLFFVVVFSVECALKILGLGMWNGPDAYFRSGWNILDFVAAAWMVFAYLQDEESLNVYALRFFRLLRPLLHMHRFREFQAAVRALFRSWTVLVLIFAMQFTCIFAISVSCVWAFRGTIHVCSDSGVPLGRDCVSTHREENGILLQRVWDPTVDSFDTIADSLLACYRTLNRSGWLAVVEEVMFSTNEHDPRPEDRIEANSLPFLAIDLVCNVILFQTVMAIMINAIDVSRGHALLTDPQRVFGSSVSLINRIKNEFVLDVQKEGIPWLQEIVLHRISENFTTLVIVVNIVVLLFESYSAPPAQRKFLQRSNTIFVYFYAFEQVVKMTAFSWAYFLPKISGVRRVSWSNVFDFVVSSLSLLEITALGGHPTGINLLRSFRALRLLNSVPSIRPVLIAAASSIQNFIGCCGLFMVFIIAFVVMGVPLFHDVKRGFELTRNTHLDNVQTGFLLMTRSAGGENWPALMYQLSVQAPSCTIPPDQAWIDFYYEKIMSPGIVRGDCGSNFAYPYFLIFTFFCKYAFMPLFAASMVSTFLQTVGQQAAVSDQDMALFTKVWMSLDRKRTGVLPAWKLKALIDKLHASGSLLAFDTMQTPQQLERVRVALREVREGRQERELTRTKKIDISSVHNFSMSGFTNLTSGPRADIPPNGQFISRLITLEDVAIVLVASKFFDTTLGWQPRQSEDFTAQAWARDANAKVLQTCLFREAQTDLPLLFYRLYVKVHCCCISDPLELSSTLYVRVKVRAPRKDTIMKNTSAAVPVSSETSKRQTTQNEVGGPVSSSETGCKCPDSPLKCSAVYRWDEILTLDFQMQEDSTIEFEILDFDNNVSVGNCSRLLRSLAHEPIATRTMHVCAKTKSLVDHKAQDVGLLSMTCSWIAPSTGGGKLDTKLRDAKRGREAGWVVMGAAVTSGARQLFPVADEQAWSAPGSGRTSPMNCSSREMSPVNFLCGNDVDCLQSIQQRRQDEMRSMIQDRRVCRTKSALKKFKPVKPDVFESRRQERRSFVKKSNLNTRASSLSLMAQETWYENNTGSVYEGDVLDSVLGLFSPRKMRTPPGTPGVVGKHQDTLQTHWLVHSASPGFVKQYTRLQGTSPLLGNNTELASTPKTDHSVGLQMMEAQIRPSEQWRRVDTRQLWLSRCDADPGDERNEVKWWLGETISDLAEDNDPVESVEGDESSHDEDSDSDVECVRSDSIRQDSVSENSVNSDWPAPPKQHSLGDKMTISKSAWAPRLTRGNKPKNSMSRRSSSHVCDAEKSSQEVGLISGMINDTVSANPVESQTALNTGRGLDAIRANQNMAQESDSKKLAATLTEIRVAGFEEGAAAGSADGSGSRGLLRNTSPPGLFSQSPSSVRFSEGFLKVAGNLLTPTFGSAGTRGPGRPGLASDARKKAQRDCSRPEGFASIIENS